MEFVNIHELPSRKDHFDACIVSTSAQSRLELIEMLSDLKITNMLIEKPVEQSLKRFHSVVQVLEKRAVHARVNFVKRTFKKYPEIKALIDYAPQFKGRKQVSILGGAIGIGCNASHLVDLIFYLFGVSSYKIIAAEISDTLIASGRGAQYFDFGGWCSIELSNPTGDSVGEMHINLSSESSAPYTISILGEHGRIDIDEIQNIYTVTMRSKDSSLPIYRYFGDYGGFESCSLEIDGIGCGVKNWLAMLSDREECKLPTVKESELVHQLIFEWLSHSRRYKEVFPIT
jgi:predicted dehydrogenase